MSETTVVTSTLSVPGEPRRLTRRALAARDGVEVPAAPVRIVHLGLGAFHRAHQAWYTAAATDAADWGISAFTGRSGTVAEQLAPQDGLYSLIERSAHGDQVSVVPSIVEVADGSDLGRLTELLAASSTALVTLTITEAGYRLTSAGEPDTADPAVEADLAWLRANLERPDLGGSASADGPRTTLGRLLLGLEARRRASGGPIAVVPCDNMPDNGAFVRTGMLALATATSARLSEWVEQNVSFVSTSVDRITPKTTPEDLKTVTRLTGWADASPVVTEPFKDWVLAGDFPAGRPEWESAGARIVDDIEPFERRKLWLLNGAHTLLAYAGLLRGCETVAAAIDDPELRAWVGELWVEADRHLPSELLDLDAYQAALLERFRNPRIEHRLEQIGMEGSTKLRVRSIAIARLERSEGRPARAAARAIAAWIVLLRSGAGLPDAHAGAVADALPGSDDGLVQRLIAVLDGPLSEDDEFVATVSRLVDELS